tara:strand:- start:5421 stop:5642 length:222 start_codon:yes stop_codon:yes gene_type:complete
LNCSTGADLQHVLNASDVLEGMPWTLPTAQATSVVGKRVKSALAQEELLGDGPAEDATEDMMIVGVLVRRVRV